MSGDNGVEELLEEVAAVTHRLARGGASEKDFDEVMGRLRMVAVAEAAEDAWETTQSATETVGSNVRRLRDAAGWKQHQLAEAMGQLGFEWSRVTVAQVEGSARRRTSYEELFAIAALFARPVAEFLIPVGHGVDLSDRLQLSGSDASELVVGRDGRLGTGGPRWRVAASLCVSASERPAGALARSEQGGATT